MFPDQICSGSNVIEVKRSQDACFMLLAFVVFRKEYVKKIERKEKLMDFVNYPGLKAWA